MNLDDCQDVVELVSDYLEGALHPDVARAFEAHLSDCRGCATYLEQVRSTVALLGRTREATSGLPPETLQGLLTAFAAVRPNRARS